MKSRLDIPTKQCNYYSEWEVYYSETLSKLNSENVLSSVELIQNKSKIYAKRPCQEILDREYTNIYRHKDEDTENFKIFLCAIFILDPGNNKTITWNKYILWCLYIYTILLNLQEWGSDTQVKL